MLPRLDCLIIGYNDIDFSFHERLMLSKGKQSPEFRVFNKEHLIIDGCRLPYTEVLNHFLNKKLRMMGQPGTNYYHVGEVSNLASVYLKSFLQRRGFNSDFASLFAPERTRLRQILEQEPLAVAITTTFYVMPSPVIDIVRFIRRYSQTTKIIVGGPLISNLCFDLQSDEDALSYVFDEIGADIYVQEAQGEGTLAQILTTLKNGGSLENMPNLYIPQAGSYVFTGIEPENQSLDACAIDWDLFADSELGATVQTRTARSCAFKCSFCDYPARAGALTLASVETVEREMRQLARRGVKNVVFVDDTFNVPMKRFKELCRMMIRNRFNFQWFSYFRCSHARDEETFDLMQASGCRAVFLGIESGDPDILKNMDKVAQLDQYRYGMKELHKRDILTFASFIAGFPGETADSIANTIDFINETQPTFYRIEPWWYNHRSPIHRRNETFELHGQGYRWQHGTMNVQEACDQTDRVFREVTGSVWMPLYNFDFWAIPYLMGKGLSAQELVRFHILAREVMNFNFVEEQADPSIATARQAAIAALEAFVNTLTLAPAKYQLSTTGSEEG